MYQSFIILNYEFTSLENKFFKDINKSINRNSNFVIKSLDHASNRLIFDYNRWLEHHYISGSKICWEFLSIRCMSWQYRNLALWGPNRPMGVNRRIYTVDKLQLSIRMSQFLCPPSKKGGHIALLLSVGLTVGLSVGLSVGPPAVSVHFLRTGCTYWNEIWYTDLS
jgi:hypothetical protein